MNDNGGNPLVPMAEKGLLIVKPHVLQVGLDAEIRNYLVRNRFEILQYRKMAVTESIARLMYDAVDYVAPPTREVASLCGVCAYIELLAEDCNRRLFSLVGPNDRSKIGTLRYMYGVDLFNNMGFCTRDDAQHLKLLEVVSVWERVFALAISANTDDLFMHIEERAREIAGLVTNQEDSGDAQEIASAEPFDVASADSDSESAGQEGDRMEAGIDIE